MDRPLMQDLNQLEDLLKAAQKKSAEFLNGINGRPTSTHYVMDYKHKLPTDGLGAAKALTQFNERFDKAIVSSTGPRYWGYVTGGATPAAILGDWLASIYDQNTQTMEGDGDISGIIERETIHLLLDLFDLPEDFMGGFVTGAALSNFTCLGVARQWLGKRLGVDIAKDGISKKMKILSATPHSSSIKSLSMLGLGSRNVIKIQTMPGNREAMDMDDLKKQMAGLNGEFRKVNVKAAAFGIMTQLDGSLLFGNIGFQPLTRKETIAVCKEFCAHHYLSNSGCQCSPNGN